MCASVSVSVCASVSVFVSAWMLLSACLPSVWGVYQPAYLCACICIVFAYLILQQCICEGGSLVSTSVAQQLLHSVTLGIAEWCAAGAGGRIHIRFGRE